MFDEEDQRPAQKTGFEPLSFDGLDVSDLKEYIEELQSEIKRAEEAISARQSALSGAESVFKT